MRFEEAAGLRDLITTVEEIEERQKMAAAKGDVVDICAVYAEPPLVALNLFHLRNGQIVDRRELFWEDQPEYDEATFFSSLLKQIYLDQQFIPAEIHVPVEFEDREALEELLSESATGRWRSAHRSAVRRKRCWAGGDQCEAQFRRALPRPEAELPRDQEACRRLNLPSSGAHRVFDISHIQGTDKVASMVVWEDGRMKKADYRKFIIKTVVGNDDFASMREVVTRRYTRLRDEKTPMPGLVLIDGGLGQLHAAAEALEAIGIVDQPLASIAKREEIIYVYGQEDEPVVLDRFSPILHLIQSIRDEAHRFAVTFHRSLRNARQLTSELDAIQGVGKRTVQKLLKEFGSLDRVRAATETELAKVVGRAAARRVISHYLAVPETPSPAS
jgi:excinuclease ABC subunit C